MKKYTLTVMYNLIIVVAAMLFSFRLQGQPQLQWERTYDGSANSFDKIISMQGFNCYVYVTGVSNSLGTGQDYLTIKYTVTGDTVWTRRYTNSAVPGGDDTPSDMVVDQNGNVYVTGKSQGNGTGYDFATVKYDAGGNVVWAKRFNNSSANGDDMAVAVKLDANQQNVIVAGNSFNYVSNSSNKDFLLIKYSAASGNELWNPPASYDYSFQNIDNLTALAIDGSGNSYAVGSNNNGGTAQLIKFSSSGAYLNSTFSSGDGEYEDVKVDNSGNTYVIGQSKYNDIDVYKLDANFYTVWSKAFNVYNLGINQNAGQFEYYSKKIEVTTSGVYIFGNIDVNPTVNVTDYNVWVAKLYPFASTVVDTAWTRRTSGWGNAMALDPANNVYVTGCTTTSGNKDMILNKYANSTGAFLQTPGNLGSLNDEGVTLAVTPDYSVLVGGYTTTNNNAEDFVAFRYRNSANPLAEAYTGGLNASICTGSSIQLGTAATNGYSYLWTPTTSLTCSTCSNPVASPSSTTKYNVLVTNTTSCTYAFDSVLITVNPKPNITASSNSPRCLGTSINFSSSPSGGTPPYTYTWSGPSTFNSTQQNPVRSNASGSMAGTYGVTVTDNHSCSATANTGVTIIQPAINNFSARICPGDSYLFKGQNLSNAGIYNDTVGVASNGCDSIVILHLSILNPQTSSSNASICNGDFYNFNGQQLNNAGTYYDTIGSSLGCDSLFLTLHLQVNSPVSANISSNICQGDSYNFNGQSLSSSGIYVDTLTSSAGCDSVVTLNLFVNTLPSVAVGNDTAVSAGASIQLFASASGIAPITNYMWSPPTGLNSVSIPNPIVGGISANTTYTVVVTDSNGCTASDAITITFFTGILDKSEGGISISPNPSSGLFLLNYESTGTGKVNVSVLDVLGRIITETEHLIQAGTNTMVIDLTNRPKEVYFLKLENDSSRLIKKLKVY